MSIYSFQGELHNMIQVPHNASWKPSAWTMTLWAKCTGETHTNGIFSTSLSGNPTTTGVCWEMQYRGLWIDILNNQSPVASLDDGAWHHAAVTFDSTDMRTYQDGALSGYGTITGLGTMVWDTNPLTLAQLGGGQTMICLPKIYNRKLSLSEIASLSGGGEVTSGLVARWTGNEGSGQTIADDTGGFNATTTGVITWSNDVPVALGSTPMLAGSGRAGFRSPLIGASPLIRRGFP